MFPPNAGIFRSPGLVSGFFDIYRGHHQLISCRWPATIFARNISRKYRFRCMLSILQFTPVDTSGFRLTESLQRS